MNLRKVNIPPYLKNKYIITIAVFGVWLMFFDQNNLWDKMKLKSRINHLEKQKQHYEVEIEQNERKLSEIQESAESLEKFAREEYLMKRKNEDIFIIVEP